MSFDVQERLLRAAAKHPRLITSLATTIHPSPHTSMHAYKKRTSMYNSPLHLGMAALNASMHGIAGGDGAGGIGGRPRVKASSFTSDFVNLFEVALAAVDEHGVASTRILARFDVPVWLDAQPTVFLRRKAFTLCAESLRTHAYISARDRCVVKVTCTHTHTPQTYHTRVFRCIQIQLRTDLHRCVRMHHAPVYMSILCAYICPYACDQESKHDRDLQLVV